MEQGPHKADCAMRLYGPNATCTCYYGSPYELTSLREIKAKLDTLAESQGKLLAALNEHDEWAKATNRTINAELSVKNEQRYKEWREAAESIAGLLLRLHERIDKFEAKPKRRKGHAKKA